MNGITPGARVGYALDRALEMGALGYKLVPIAPGEKYPKGLGRWQDQATNRLAKLKQWFALTENGIGWAMGEQPNGTFVFAVDVDGEEGMTQLIEMLKEHGQEEFFNTACQMTGGGGMHFIFTSDVPITNSAKQIAPKIDIRGEGGQIVIGPTIHPSGNPYVWQKLPDSRVPIPAPGWLIDLITSEPEPIIDVDDGREHRAAPTRSTTSVVGSDDQSPADWVRENYPIPDMLAVGGWTYMESKGEDQLWCRPGKNPKDGHSAILHGEGPLVVFSTEVAWRLGRDNRDGSISYSPIEVYANIEHGGDLSAASSMIRRQHMPDVPRGTDPILASVPVTGAAVTAGSAAGTSTMTEAQGAPNINLPDEFWASRDWLGQIRIAAWSRGLAPDAVLGAVLARYAATIPVSYRIPAIVGAPATFDHLSVLVGDSAAGKSAAMAVAEELLPDRFEKTINWSVPVPSGEGLIDAFYDHVEEEDEKGRTKEVYKRVFDAVFFSFDEAKQLIDINNRSGATIGSVILSAWSGHRVGQSNASRDRKRKLEARTFRVSGLMGIQSKRGHEFLAPDLVESGLPGRIVWFAAEDPSMPDWQDAPEWGGDPLSLTAHPVVPTMVTYDQVIWDEVREAHWAAKQKRVHEEPIDGHTRLARLKIAGMISLADGSQHVDSASWNLAGQIAHTSTSLRKYMARLGGDRRTAAARDRGHMDAIQKSAADETAHRIAVNKASAAILQAITEHGPVKKKALKQHINSRLRRSDIMNQALSELVDISKVKEGPDGWVAK